MASTEDKAYEIMRELDVDYVLVIFGGLTGYSSDGENHSLNMEVDLHSLFGLHVT
jgi:dolichyl-diphosphooligosaccharide--protein glycosyltransferase